MQQRANETLLPNAVRNKQCLTNDTCMARKSQDKKVKHKNISYFRNTTVL